MQGLQTNAEVDKSLIPTYNILGVNIAAIDMEWALSYLNEHLPQLAGDYICVSNVHTVVTASEDESYRRVQNGGVMALPDGAPLSILAHLRGCKQMERITGPDLMGEIFRVSAERGYRHFFYGSTLETLQKLREEVQRRYSGLEVAGMYSPPFRPLSMEEDDQIVREINAAAPDFVWVGLGAPKQELWMAQHQGRVNALMIGVGAGFDYHAGNIKRAPEWMQRCALEWLYRLLQDPVRLAGRYLAVNSKFIWKTVRGR